MTDDLRKDLTAIVLEEAFGILEGYARKLVNGQQGSAHYNRADEDAMEAAHHIVSRFDARCSKIEG
jgi:hypothetical protein